MALNFDAFKKELQELETSKQGMYPRFRPQQGRNIVRLLPEYDTTGMFFHKVFFHWKIADKSFPCERSFERDCYLCGVIKYLRETGKDNLAQRWNARPNYFMNAINMTSPESITQGVQVLTVTRPVMTPILGFLENPSFQDLLDPEKGRNLFIEVKGQGIETQYNVYPDGEKSPLADAETLLKNMHQLNTLVRPSTTEAMKAAVQKVLQGGEEGPAEPQGFTPSTESAPIPAVPETTPPSGKIEESQKAKLDDFLQDFEKR